MAILCWSPPAHRWWAHAPFFALFVSLVFFVRSYLGAGRLWLAWTAIGVRAASLVLNFLVDPNLNYVRIDGIRPLEFLGETIYLTEGVFSGRTRLGQLSSLLYKEEIELMLRTPDIAGFQLLGLHDYPGTGSALIGTLAVLFWGWRHV